MATHPVSVELYTDGTISVTFDWAFDEDCSEDSKEFLTKWQSDFDGRKIVCSFDPQNPKEIYDAANQWLRNFGVTDALEMFEGLDFWLEKAPEWQKAYFGY